MSCLSQYKQIALVSVIITLVLFLSLFSAPTAIAQTPVPTPNPTADTVDNSDDPDKNQSTASEDPVDSDGDGLSDILEETGWTISVNGIDEDVTSNPKSIDTDEDGLSDYQEWYGVSSAINGLLKGPVKTHPESKDTDGDGLDDNSEISGELTLVIDGEKISITLDPSLGDTDSDGLTDSKEIDGWKIKINGEEIHVWSDPREPDSDKDGLPDESEYTGHSIDNIMNVKTNPWSVDTDQDGLLDNKEVEDQTNPSRADTDFDGIPDGEELELETDPTKADTDGDRLDDLVETQGWTISINGKSTVVTSNPLVSDSDEDGLTDYQEWDGLNYNQFNRVSGISLKTDPFNDDTDEDGMSDGEEYKKGCNPLLSLINSPVDPEQCEGSDDDSDFLSDEYEIANGYEEDNADSDNDGLPDGKEVLIHGTNPTTEDSDDDGLDDLYEIEDAGTNPNSPDSDGDGLNDYPEVHEHLTDPNNPDTDLDGVNDGDEANGWGINIDGSTHTVSSDPTLIDTDSDGISDSEEFDYLTDPRNPDTDLDGVNDGDEITSGTDPKTPDSSLADSSAENNVTNNGNANPNENPSDVSKLSETERASKGAEGEIDTTGSPPRNAPDVDEQSGNSTADSLPSEEQSGAGETNNPVQTFEPTASGLKLGSIILIAALFIGVIATVLGILIILRMRTRQPTSPQTPFRTIRSGGPITDNLTTDVNLLTNALRQTDNDATIPDKLSALAPRLNSGEIRELVVLLTNISTPNAIDSMQRERLRNSIVTTSEKEEFNQLPSDSTYEAVFDYVIASNNRASRANQDAYDDEQKLKSDIGRLIRACSSDIPDSSQRRIPLGLLNTCNTILDSSETGSAKVIAVQNVNVILELLYSWFFPNRRP